MNYNITQHRCPGQIGDGHHRFTNRRLRYAQNCPWYSRKMLHHFEQLFFRPTCVQIFEKFAVDAQVSLILCITTYKSWALIITSVVLSVFFVIEYSTLIHSKQMRLTWETIKFTALIMCRKLEDWSTNQTTLLLSQTATVQYRTEYRIFVLHNCHSFNKYFETSN